MTRQVARARFHAMSVDIELLGVDVAAAEVERVGNTAVRLAAVWEATFSRFLPGSELSRLNVAGGHPLRVSARFIQVLDLALAATRRTAGRFDPTILPALAAAGYDRDIAQVRGRRLRPAVDPVPAAGLSGVEHIRVNRRRHEVTLPPGIRLDFGGIAKGVFVDLVVAMATGWPGGSVDAGGDLRVWGVPPDGTHWTVGIEDPRDVAADLRTVEIVGDAAAGVATSGVNRRRWQAGERPMHHLIDPATGRPLAGSAVQVSAFAPSVAAAEVATKALMVAAARGEPLDPMTAAAAILVYADGRVVIVPGTCPDACVMVPPVSTGQLAQSRRSA